MLLFAFQTLRTKEDVVEFWRKVQEVEPEIQPAFFLTVLATDSKCTYCRARPCLDGQDVMLGTVSVGKVVS